MAAAHLKGPEIAINHARIPIQCAGKVAFDSPALAVGVTHRANYERKDGSLARQHYRCTYCGKWHVGTVHNPVMHRAAGLVRSE